MSVRVSLQHANRGGHFRAHSVRGLPAGTGPVLGVDHAWISAPTHSPHPHAGMSAVSYLFLDSETGLRHRDSLGADHVIRPGGLQWTSAGRGLMYEQIPAQTGKTVHALEILVELPLQARGAAPRTWFLEPQEVPVVQLPGVRVRVPVGDFGRARSPLPAPTQVSFLEVSLQAGARLRVPLARGQGGFLLPVFGRTIVAGEVFEICDLKLRAFAAQPVSQDIELQAESSSAKVMLFLGDACGDAPAACVGRRTVVRA